MNQALLKEDTITSLYSEEELQVLRLKKVPGHIAIIMDGNRRWAQKQVLPFMSGHWKGADALTLCVNACLELGVKVLTVYAFSTENWQRSEVEVRSLMHLFRTFLVRQRPSMVKGGVRLSTIGDPSRFPDNVQKTLDETIEATKEGDQLDLVIAANYGARDEMKRAVKAIIDDCMSGKVSKENLSENLIASYLDTARFMDPDLVIRTGGESRMSNFLLWQSSYSEVVVSPVLWPDFSERDLLSAIGEYQKREKRLGK